MLTDHDARLLDGMAKLNVLLASIKSKNADFAFVHSRDVQLQQAHCWVHLARIRRLALTKTATPHAIGRPALNVDGIVECLSQAREIFFLKNGERSNIKSFIHGRIQVLVEEAELMSLQREPSKAIRLFDEALQLCFAVRDHAKELLVTSKLQALRLDLDTWAKLDQLANNPQENASEREILEKCFFKVAERNETTELQKDQLAAIAQELGAQTALNSDEVEEIWMQIRAHGTAASSKSNTVKLEAFWRWWMAEEMYDFRNQCRRHGV